MITYEQEHYYDLWKGWCVVGDPGLPSDAG